MTTRINNFPFFSPLKKAYYLLWEARRQRKDCKEALKSVIHKWQDHPEQEISIISKRLQLWLFLSDWGWLIGLFMILTGFTAVNYVNYLVNRSDANCLLDNNCITLIKAATVSDIDSPNFAGGNLTVGFTKGGTPDDKIFIYNQGNNEGEIRVKGNQVFYENKVIGNFQGGLGKEPLLVTFNQDATPKAVEALLSRITYQNVSPNKSIGSRKIEVQITDGDSGINNGTSKPLFQTVVVINDSNAPSINLPSDLAVNENKILKITGISINDSNSKNITVTLTVFNGTITVKSNVDNGLKLNNITGNKTKQVTLKGTINEINTTLAEPSAVIYQSIKDFSGNDSLLVTVNDVEKTSTQNTDLVFPPNAKITKITSNNVSITVNSVNTPSIVKLPSAQNVNEDSKLNIGGIAIKDPDTQNLTVTLEVTNGTLNVKDKIAKGLGNANIDNNKTQKVTLNGNIAQINTTLADAAAIAYQGTKDFNGNDSLNITVDDGKHKAIQAVSITVNPVNDPPVIDIVKAPTPTPTSSPNLFENRVFPQRSCGDLMPDNSNAYPVNFYPVYVEYSDSNLAKIKDQFCSDAYRMNRKDKGIVAIQVASFTSYETAQMFANFLTNRVGFADVGKPKTFQSPIQTPSPQPPPPASSSRTNATVSGQTGTKNLRSGPGTIYGVVGTVYTGDRILILGSSYDGGGYQWYKVYHPQSGVTGWLAAQLVTRD